MLNISKHKCSYSKLYIQFISSHILNINFSTQFQHYSSLLNLPKHAQNDSIHHSSIIQQLYTQIYIQIIFITYKY